MFFYLEVIILKLGLALAGGGMRGIAHAGVIKALEDNGIKVDAIGGASSGSYIASLYAMGYSPAYIYSLFKKYAKKIAHVNNSAIISEIRNIAFSRKIRTRGIKDGKDIEEMFDKLSTKKGIRKIKDIKMPIVITAVDISESKEYMFTNYVRVDAHIDPGGCGHPPLQIQNSHYISDISVGKAVRASSSFPAVIAPCEYESHMFCDGGMLNNVPVIDVKEMGMDKIIAVIFDSDTVNDKSNAMDIMMKTVDIMCNKISEENLSISDYTLTIPSDGTGLLDISKIDFCYKSGYNTTIEKIEEIKKVLK